MSDPKDIFAKFRAPEGAKGEKHGGEIPETEEDDEGEPLPPLIPESYTAFRLGKRRERLLIARVAQPMRFPAYHELRDISFDQTYQQHFILFFQAMTVEVTGKNLWPVVHAISNGRCAAIYQHHSKLYPALPPKNAPLIQSIKLEPPVALTDDQES